MTQYGYVRTSTKDQRTSRQVDALLSHRCAALFIDAGVSGTIAPNARPQFNALLSQLSPGDVVVVSDLARLGRNLTDLVKLVDQLNELGASMKSLHEDISTDPRDSKNTQLIAFFGMFAQLERELMSERTLEGLASARARGRVGGRPTVMTPERMARVRELHSAGVSKVEMSQKLGIARATLYRALNQIAKEPLAG